jgi:hypothetical protein
MPLTPSALLRVRAPSKSLFRSAVEKIFRSGAGIDNLMHASLLNSGGKA